MQILIATSARFSNLCYSLDQFSKEICGKEHSLNFIVECSLPLSVRGLRVRPRAGPSPVPTTRDGESGRGPPPTYAPGRSTRDPNATPDRRSIVPIPLAGRCGGKWSNKSHDPLQALTDENPLSNREDPRRQNKKKRSHRGEGGFYNSTIELSKSRWQPHFPTPSRTPVSLTFLPRGLETSPRLKGDLIDLSPLPTTELRIKGEKGNQRDINLLRPDP